MSLDRFHVFHGPNEPTHGGTESPITHQSFAPETTTVRFGELLPVLFEAYQSNRAWVQDFADDEVTLSADLFEVISAYQHFRKSA